MGGILPPETFDRKEKIQLLRFTIRRIFSAIPVLLIVVTLVFALVRIIPGDPTVMILGEEAEPEAYEALRERMGLNDPLIVQYFRYLKDIITGDWGVSYYNQKPVFENIFSRWEPTIVLTLYSTALAILIGIPAGIISARKHNSPLDYTVTTLSATGMSAPGFWIGLMLVYLLGVKLHWFPVQGYTTIAEGGLKGALYSLTMPAFTLSLSHQATLCRYTRTMMLDVLNNDYIRTARAKGMSDRVVFYRHALKNSLAPVVTNVGFAIAAKLGGSTVTETVFNIPGMGKLAYDSLMRRDYDQEQAIILFVAILLIFTNILLDIVYKILDPRIEFD